jgi:hypothetical protein
MPRSPRFQHAVVAQNLTPLEAQVEEEEEEEEEEEAEAWQMSQISTRRTMKAVDHADFCCYRSSARC